MLIEDLKSYSIILASQSPRRKQLLKELGLNFQVVKTSVEENYPSDLQRDEIALYLAEKKAKSIAGEMEDNSIIIASDTIVCYDGIILNKPENYQEAFGMLKSISGREHDVITGVCIMSKHRVRSFSSETRVSFTHLDDEEIKYYIDKWQPFDKAGSYGIQEWIGYVGVERIEGSYFNVIGLPVQKLYSELKNFVRK